MIKRLPSLQVEYLWLKEVDSCSLGVREWEWEVCRTHHDRDINASINILLKGLKYSFV